MSAVKPTFAGFVWLALTALAAPPAAAGPCALTRMPDIPVTMQGLVPIVIGQVAQGNERRRPGRRPGRYRTRPQIAERAGAYGITGP